MNLKEAIEERDRKWVLYLIAEREQERWAVGEELCILIGFTMLKDTKAGILLGEQLRDYMNHYLKRRVLKEE